MLVCCKEDIPPSNNNNNYLIVDNILVDEEIRKNFMGIVSDEGPNMAAKYKGACLRLQEMFPYIVVVQDLSHIYNKIF